MDGEACSPNAGRGVRSQTGSLSGGAPTPRALAEWSPHVLRHLFRPALSPHGTQWPCVSQALSVAASLQHFEVTPLGALQEPKARNPLRAQSWAHRSPGRSPCSLSADQCVRGEAASFVACPWHGCARPTVTWVPIE